ncbi:MAG TPA: hypothetical protein VMG12_32800 [Polyangiaceae bacterium]|nr:hypothetical protein [Polyangiaceae bacterium]
MSIDRMGNELAALGVSGRDGRCLLLLPQIYVGWVMERRDVAALEALLDTTVRRAQFDADVLALARGWLFERPSRAQFQSGFALLRALRRAPERPTIVSSDLLEAMLWACRAAQLDRRRSMAGKTLGVVSPPVARALFDLEAWLEIDAAELWNDLLDEDPPPSSLPAARFHGLSDAELESATAVLEPADDDERSQVLMRDESAGPASAPFPLLRRLA